MGRYEILKDKLRHIKIVRVYLSKNLFNCGSTKPEVVRSTLLTGARGKTFTEKRQEAKQGNDLIGCSLSSCIIWESGVGCL